MRLSLEQALIEVWRPAVVQNTKTVELGPVSYPVRRTPNRGLRQVDFVFDGNEIRGLEQNPQTKSRWAQMARSGKKVMQFLSEGRYVANVVDGKVTLYGPVRNGRTKTMKPEEKLFSETFITVHPEFLAMKSWIPGPEPPDVIITDASDGKIGIELTEWLDKRQTTPSISTTENEMRWLTALDSENHPQPRHFQCTHLWFRNGTRFWRREEGS